MSANFSQRLAELPPNLANHMMITIIALGVGVLLSVPLGIWLVKRKGLRYPILTTAGVIQTIPSLALLALMVPLLDKTNGLGLGWNAFGFYPAVIALTLYSVLPILRNTVTAILGVDPAMTEAARGVGMTERQVLWKVELPLSAPIIIAGIRTATVWVVGIATLATPVGQRCLGNFIFTGLQTRNWTMVMFGVVCAAGLAIVLDLLIAGLQKASEDRRRALGVVSGTLLCLVVAGGLFSPRLVRVLEDSRRIATSSPLSENPATDVDTKTEPKRTSLRIGTKTFSEQYILGELMTLLLEEEGFRVESTESLGSTVIFNALASGDLDLYIDYSGTIWANYMKREDVAAPWKVLAEMNAWLSEKHGIRSLGSLGFENAYALVMREDRAEKLNLESIADLSPHTSEMKIGGDYEFFGRPEWEQIKNAYALNFRDQVSYDSSFMYQAVADGQVAVISAFSSDGRIAAFNLKTLEDPKNVIPPYDAVLLMAPDIADREDIARVLKPMIGGISVKEMRQANLQVDREEEKKTPEEAARWLRNQL